MTMGKKIAFWKVSETMNSRRLARAASGEKMSPKRRA